MAIMQLLDDATSKLADDDNYRSMLNNFLLTPIQDELNSGRFDKCLAFALVRVTLPLIILVFVLILVSIVQIAVSVRLIQAGVS